VTEVWPPYSEACERNKVPIATVLRVAFADVTRVLEIGSGTGQHAIYFAEQLPHLQWQPTDQADYLPGLQARLGQAEPDNIAPVINLDVRMATWPVSNFDGVFSANTLHYMSATCVHEFFRGIGQALNAGGVLAIYGPFKYDNSFTSESNERFEVWLQTRDPAFGIRDFEWVTELAAKQQLTFEQDIAMPANNQLLLWRKRTRV